MTSSAATSDPVAVFVAEHRAATWLTVAQVDRNPYLWSGTRVGMVVRLQRMVDPATALVQQPGKPDGPAIVLDAVSPETFRRETVIIVASVDRDRVPLHAQPHALSSATLVAAMPCTDDLCDDFLASDVAWGKPLAR